MKNGLVALVLLLASPVAASIFEDPAAQHQADVNHQKVPPLKLGSPDWQPMNGRQIVAALTGRTLVVDEDYRPFPDVRVRAFHFGGCPTGEQFFSDGTWKRYVCKRAFKVYSGTWTTERFRRGERLCVVAADFPRLCRFLWAGAAPDRVFMAASAEVPGESMDDPIVFNPYRLVVMGK